MPDFMHNFRPQQNEFKMDRLTMFCSTMNIKANNSWFLLQILNKNVILPHQMPPVFAGHIFDLRELCQHAGYTGVSCLEPAQAGVQCFAQLYHFLCLPQDWSFCGWDVTVSHARADARSQWSQVNGAERRRLSERIFRIQTDTQYSWINMSANLAA